MKDVQKKLFGQSIEHLACQFLEHNGLELIQKNYYCRLGEVDLVMFDSKTSTLVFVEVRFRANTFYGDPTETVDWKKQRKLKRTVLHYLQKLGDARQAARVDVIGVSDFKPSTPNSSSNQSLHDVSIHEFKQYQLVWTRNAISD